MEASVRGHYLILFALRASLESKMRDERRMRRQRNGRDASVKGIHCSKAGICILANSEVCVPAHNCRSYRRSEEKS